MFIAFPANEKVKAMTLYVNLLELPMKSGSASNNCDPADSSSVKLT